jgi:hypothetical protein
MKPIYKTLHDSSLTELASLILPWKINDDRILHRIKANALDVSNLDAIVRRILTEMAGLSEPDWKLTCRLPSIVTETASILKAYLFFLRSYHDALAEGFLSAQGQPSSARTSMAKLIGLNKRGKSKELRAHLEREVPGYCSWFERMRRNRNRTKESLDVAYTYGEYGSGIVFMDKSDSKPSMKEYAFTSRELDESMLMSKHTTLCLLKVLDKETSNKSIQETP